MYQFSYVSDVLSKNDLTYKKLFFNDGFGSKVIEIYSWPTDNKLIKFKFSYIQVYSSLTRFTDFQGLSLKIFGNI